MKKEHIHYYRLLLWGGFIIVLAFLITYVPSAHASGWVDSWLDQKTTTPAGHFEGQKRGYWTGGAFSGRVHTSRDYLATVMPPKLSAGCGGIDIFSGGISLLDFDYLVQKMQNILQAAPAAAFDIALNVLCEPCANTIKSLEAIADSLNQLQLDDCKASRAVVAKIMSPLAGNNSAKQAQLHAETSKFMASSGIEGNWTKLKEKLDGIWDNNPPSETKPDDTGMLSGCPAIIKQVFLTTGSLLKNVADTTGFDNVALLNLTRGVVGDIIIKKIDGNTRAYYVPACAKNANATFDNLLEGNVYAMTVDGSGVTACSLDPSSNINITDHVGTKMRNIADKIRNEQTLTDEEGNFIDSNPLSLGGVLKMAVGTQQETSVISSLASITAKAYVHQFLQDLYGTALWLYDTQISIASANSVNPKKCQLSVLGPNIIDAGSVMREKVRELKEDAYVKFVAALREADTIYSFVNKMSTFNTVLQKSTSKGFGGTAAAGD
ncbi:MAG: conjugal transfer protein TraH [Deltaproteobacteria bacterium]|nr:conjugal transfer protein TraH [Deltaproteobacteria bacterium]